MIRTSSIQSVLDRIGHPDAWISSLSSIGDFRPSNCDKDMWECECSLALGFSVEYGDLIVDVARRLAETTDEQAAAYRVHVAGR